MTEIGFTCTPCTPICGDGLLWGNEECDDFNTNDLDGCSHLCLKELYWDCTIASPSVCNPICGDGVIIPPFEECDDSNINSNDGCDFTCLVE